MWNIVIIIIPGQNFLDDVNTLLIDDVLLRDSKNTYIKNQRWTYVIPIMKCIAVLYIKYKLQSKIIRCAKQGITWSIILIFKNNLFNSPWNRRKMDVHIMDIYPFFQETQVAGFNTHRKCFAPTPNLNKKYMPLLGLCEIQNTNQHYSISTL